MVTFRRMLSISLFLVLCVFLVKAITKEKRDLDPVMLFEEYGWTVDKTIKTINATMPKSFRHYPGTYPINIYWAFNDEISKKMGYKLSKYRGKEVKLTFFELKEELPEVLRPYTEAIGVVVIYKNKIIAAWVSSLNGVLSLDSNFYIYKNVTDYSWPEWLLKRKIVKRNDSIDTSMKDLESKEIVLKFFKNINDKKYIEALACFTRRYLMNLFFYNLEKKRDAKSDLEDDAENDSFKKVFSLDTQIDRIFLGRLINIENIKVIEIKKFIAKERYIRAFGVYTEETHKNKGKINKIWIVFLKKEIVSHGWRIADVREAS